MCSFQPLSGIWSHGLWHSRNFPLTYLWLLTLFILCFLLSETCSDSDLFHSFHWCLHAGGSQVIPVDLSWNCIPYANFYCTSPVVYLTGVSSLTFLNWTHHPSHPNSLPSCSLSGLILISITTQCPTQNLGIILDTSPYSSHLIIPPNSSLLVPLRSVFLHTSLLFLF